MKLRNKKTGEIIECSEIFESLAGVIRIRKPGSASETYPLDYHSLSELFDEWEDYKELNDKYEDAPEETKPFEEVAIVKETVTLGIGKHEDYKENQIEIADIDYYEILPDGAKKTKFTWDEAMEIEKKTNGKWRLPTATEWTAIVVAFGCDDKGDFDGKLFAKRLNLTTGGDGYGSFWSSTAHSTTNARFLLFSASNIYPQDYDNKVYGFSVRLVRGEKS